MMEGVVMGTILRIGDAGILDKDIGDCVVAAAAYGTDGETVAARAGSSSESDILWGASLVS